MKTPTLAALLAALLLAVPGAAQLNLRVEQRVRLVAPAAGLTAPTPATVVGFRGDSVLLQLSAAQVQVPMAAISRIERSRGRARLATAIVGAVVGAGVGYGVGRAADRRAGTDMVREPCEFSVECPSEFRMVEVDRFPPEDRVPYAAGGLLAGVGIGAYLGIERWEKVPLYATLSPSRGGELSIRLRR